jgi:hypothetical protein
VANRVQRLKRIFCCLKTVGTEIARAKASLIKIIEPHNRPDLIKVEILLTYVNIKKIPWKALPLINFNKLYFFIGVKRLLNFHFRLLWHDSLRAVEK